MFSGLIFAHSLPSKFQMRPNSNGLTSCLAAGGFPVLFEDIVGSPVTGGRPDGPADVAVLLIVRLLVELLNLRLQLLVQVHPDEQVLVTLLPKPL